MQLRISPQLLLLCGLGVVQATAQSTTPLVFGTGVDNAGQPLPVGQIDPHYRLITNLDSSSQNALATQPWPTWLSPSGASRWIAPRQDSSTYASGAVPPGNYVYETTFDLTGFDPSTIRLVGRWATDNEGVDILINGISTGTKSLNEPTSYSYMHFTEFTIASGFVPGLNRLAFIVNNAGVDESNPSGLITELAVERAEYGLCLLYNPAKPAKSGSTIPIKVQLCVGSNNISSAGLVLHAISITHVSNTVTGEPQDSGNANPDNNFRFDPSLGGNGGYIFNLKTTGLSTGSYSLNFTVSGDAFTYSAPFQIK